jgi:cell division protein FtsW (lipid II flippase)
MPLFISKQKNQQWYVDLPLLLPVIALMSIGFIMVSSASFSFGDHRLGDELFFFKRHLGLLGNGFSYSDDLFLYTIRILV